MTTSLLELLIAAENFKYEGMAPLSTEKPSKNSSEIFNPPKIALYEGVESACQFQLPRLCLSCISIVEEKKENKYGLSSFRGHLSYTSSRVKLELGLG